MLVQDKIFLESPEIQGLINSYQYKFEEDIENIIVAITHVLKKLDEMFTRPDNNNQELLFAIEQILLGEHCEIIYKGKFSSLQDFLKDTYMDRYFSDVKNWGFPFNNDRVIDWDYVEECYLLNRGGDHLDHNNYYFEFIEQ